MESKNNSRQNGQRESRGGKKEVELILRLKHRRWTYFIRMDGVRREGEGGGGGVKTNIDCNLFPKE